MNITTENLTATVTVRYVGFPECINNMINYWKANIFDLDGQLIKINVDKMLIRTKLSITFKCDHSLLDVVQTMYNL